MRNTVHNHLRGLFSLSLCICLLLGAIMTLAQFFGVLLELAWLVEGSERLLLTPAIAAAAAFGLFSFFASYFQLGGPDADEEQEEI